MGRNWGILKRKTKRKQPPYMMYLSSSWLLFVTLCILLTQKNYRKRHQRDAVQLPYIKKLLGTRGSGGIRKRAKSINNVKTQVENIIYDITSWKDWRNPRQIMLKNKFKSIFFPTVHNECNHLTTSRPKLYFDSSSGGTNTQKIDSF